MHCIDRIKLVELRENQSKSVKTVKLPRIALNCLILPYIRLIQAQYTQTWVTQVPFNTEKTTYRYRYVYNTPGEDYEMKSKLSAGLIMILTNLGEFFLQDSLARWIRNSLIVSFRIRFSLLQQNRF